MLLTIARTFQIYVKKYSLRNTAVMLQICNLKHTVPTQTFQPRDVGKVGPLGWFLLIIPGATFALGTWQVQRKKWKENLMAELKARTSTDPMELPKSVEEIYELEYHPVHVRGQFLHDKEIYLGPRSLMRDGDSTTTSSLLTKAQSASHGYLVITPFKLADREQTILINRGWVSHKQQDLRTQTKHQPEGEVDIIGIVRMQENRPVFMPANNPKGNSWFYRDLPQMCAVTGADPIFLDATNDSDIEGGPIGGQTRISLRNEHMSYIFTWYSLSAITSFMWYSQFIKGVRL